MTTASLEFKLDRARLRQVRRREGRYLLRTNLAAQEPARLWRCYIQLTEIEQAFKELKHDLAVRGRTRGRHAHARQRVQARARCAGRRAPG